MKHEIDLSKYQIRTDLAIELINKKNITKNKEEYKNIKIYNFDINNEQAKLINKKPGNYITIEFDDITDHDNMQNVKKVFEQQIKKLLKKLNIKHTDSALIIGLGNNKSTPDSLGPETINKIIVTNHLYELNELDKDYRRVSAIIPGVMGNTGIETSDIIESITKKIKPNFVIVIDALAASSIERVNKTIQITDTGIHPGSGVGNNRKEISKEILNIPVIAIGVPTTVDAVTIVSDTIEYTTKHFTYIKENINNPINKLIVTTNKKELKQEVNLNDKINLLGLIGTLNKNETRQLIHEVLTPIGYNFMVTPKEIDYLIVKLTDIIGYGLNDSLHNKNL